MFFDSIYFSIFLVIYLVFENKNVSYLVISEKCPIENNTDFETNPKIHDHIEND